MALSNEALNKMKALTNLNDLATLKAKVQSLTIDLNEEGFMKDEIAVYINNIINKEILKTKV